MFPKKVLVSCLFFAALLVLSGCSADLLPVKSPGQPDNITGFCKAVGNAQTVVVSVRNQGNAEAPASTTTITFSPGGPVSVQTPAIPAGDSVDLSPVDIPAGCFDPDCDFTITVDSNNQVSESNEDNNTAEGRCIG